MKEEQCNKKIRLDFSFCFILFLVIIALAFFGRVAFLKENGQDGVFRAGAGTDPEINILQANLRPRTYPLRDWSVQEPQIEVDSYLVFSNKEDKLLAGKSIGRSLPVASLTKLMTAFLVRDSGVAGEERIKIPKINWLEMNTRLPVGGDYSASKLLQAMLSASNNESAYAFAGYVGTGTSSRARVESFVARMNKKVRELGLSETHFSNPAGFDEKNHYSSARDLLVLVRKILEFYPSLFGNSLKLEVELGLGEDLIRLPNSNCLVGQLDNLTGQKTGNTREAGGTMVLIEDNGSGEIIYVVLGSESRAEDMKELVDWTHRAYKFGDEL